MNGSTDVLDTLPRMRANILRRIKDRGRATTYALSKDLHVTHEGIRRHLVELQRDGLVVSECVPYEQPKESESRAVGRPPATYCLTPAGEQLFPKRYDELAVLLVDSAAESGGDEMLLLARVTANRMKPLFKRKPKTLRDGFRALRSMYLREDPFLEIERDGIDYLVIEKNCPFLNVALERPRFCSTSVSMMRNILGVEVARERRFQDGDGRCVFRVFTRRPVSARRRKRFELEPTFGFARNVER